LSRIALHGGEPAVTHSLPTYPDIGDEEINAVVHQMRTGPLSIAGTGGIITEFEENFAKYHDVPFALSTNSGTSTLHVALWGAGVVAGSEVITPANTWISAICAILHANGVPVWCDIKPGTCAADAADIERKITTRTHAIMVCHLFGMPADMDKILAVGRKHGIPVIEDCSHGHGGVYKGKKLGTIGAMGCFSLQASKSMIAGEGGVMITNDQYYYERAMLVGHVPARLLPEVKLEVNRRWADTGFAWKYRCAPLSAAIANVQLRKLDTWNENRRANVELLKQQLEGIGCIEFSEIPADITPGFYGHPAFYHPEKLNGIPRSRFLEALRAEGLGLGTGYDPWHEKPLFQIEDPRAAGLPWAWPEGVKMRPARPGDLPVTEALNHSLLLFPAPHAPCPDTMKDFAEAIHKVVENASELENS